MHDGLSAQRTNSVSEINSKRTKIEILAEILEVCRKPAVKTKVMYKTNLSYTIMQKSVRQLLKLELLEFDEMAKKYQASEKGLEFLKRYSAVVELLTL